MGSQQGRVVSRGNLVNELGGMRRHSITLSCSKHPRQTYYATAWKYLKQWVMERKNFETLTAKRPELSDKSPYTERDDAVKCGRHGTVLSFRRRLSF
jgi:hypothetical protein